jgi:hypothetical protein
LSNKKSLIYQNFPSFPTAKKEGIDKPGLKGIIQSFVAVVGSYVKEQFQKEQYLI